MEIIIQQKPGPAQKEAIYHLWNREYPEVLHLAALEDLERYFAGIIPKCHLFLLDDTGAIGGWLLLFERAEETWFAMILDRRMQGWGYGTRLLEKAKSLAPVLNGWAVDQDSYLKADGTAYPSPLAFYRKNGFAVLETLRLTQPVRSVKVRWQEGNR